MRCKIFQTVLFTTILLLSACFGHAPSKEGCQGCVEVPIVRPETAFVKIMGFIGKEPLVYGSGSVIANNTEGAYILSAAHVCMFLEGYGIPDIPNISPEVLAPLLSMHGIYHDGRITRLTIVDYDIDTDLCIMLAGKPNTNTLSLADRSPEFGKSYKTYSSPKGMAGPGSTLIYDGFHSGVIKVPKRDLTYNLFTIWSAPGSSGSPIMNEDNEVVGVISRYLKDGTPASISPQHKDLQTFVQKVMCSEKVEGYCSESRD